MRRLRLVEIILAKLVAETSTQGDQLWHASAVSGALGPHPIREKSPDPVTASLMLERHVANALCAKQIPFLIEWDTQ